MGGAEARPAVEARGTAAPRAGRGSAAGGRWRGPPSPSPRSARRLGEAQQLGPGAIGDAVGDPVDQVEAPGDLRPSGPSKPNRLITPSTSTARTGRSGSRIERTEAELSQRCPAIFRRRAEHQPADQKGAQAPAEEGRHPRPQVRPGPQAPDRRPAAARRLHARLHGDAEEAELGAAQGRPRPAHQRDGGHLLHPGRGPQPSGALGRPRARRPRQGPAGRPLQGDPRHARRLRRLGPQAVPLACTASSASRCPAAPAPQSARSSPTPFTAAGSSSR